MARNNDTLWGVKGVPAPTAAFGTTLSALVQQLNGLFGGELSDADLISYARHVSGKMFENPVLAHQAASSSKEQFLHGDFRQDMMNAGIFSMKNHRSMSDQVLGKSDVREGFASILADLVYEGFEKQRNGGEA